ncbi:MAG TPA: helix-turn-helix domain-containing protein [Kofleriaceae bacterium]|nr:helix-turn-helix domain-containing protein [Kofleriaceae bacterium]
MPARRTQRERREGTIRKLLDAATDTLIEVGYAEASVQRICDRAAMSQGALFRHFATREDLMVAVGADVGARILDGYRKKFVAAAKRKSDVEAALRLVREACRSRLNQAWYELETASRTNENLRKALEPVSRGYFDAITELARELLPELAIKLGPSFDLVVTSVIMMFDGETTHRFLVRDPELEDARFAMLVRGMSMFAG